MPAERCSEVECLSISYEVCPAGFRAASGIWPGTGGMEEPKRWVAPSRTIPGGWHHPPPTFAATAIFLVAEGA